MINIDSERTFDNVYTNEGVVRVVISETTKVTFDSEEDRQRYAKLVSEGLDIDSLKEATECD